MQFLASLKAGAQEHDARLAATPEVRAAVDRAATRSGAQASGVAGEAAAALRRQQHRQPRPDHDRPDRHPGHRAAAGPGAAQPRSPALPDRERWPFLPGRPRRCPRSSSSTSGATRALASSCPFLMFIFLLALGEDYNILVMTRIREEAQHLPLRAGGGPRRRRHRPDRDIRRAGSRRDLRRAGLRRPGAALGAARSATSASGWRSAS